MKNSLKNQTPFNLNVAAFIALGALSVTNAQAGFELITEQSQEAHNFVSTGETRNINQKSVDVTSANEQYAQLAMNARDAERAMGTQPNLKTPGGTKIKGGQRELVQPKKAVPAIDAPVIEHTDDPQSTPDTLKVGAVENPKLYNGNLFEIARTLQTQVKVGQNKVGPLEVIEISTPTQPQSQALVGLSGGEDHFQAYNQSGESKSLLDIMRENRRTPKTKDEFVSNLLLTEKTKEVLALQAQNELLKTDNDLLRQKLAQYENANTPKMAKTKGKPKTSFVVKKGGKKTLMAKTKKTFNERIALK